MITCTTGTLFPGCTRLLARASLGNRSVAHHGLILSISHNIPTMGSGSTTGANITSFRHHFSFLTPSKHVSHLPTSRFHKLISPSSAPSCSLRIKSGLLSRATAHKFSSSTPLLSSTTTSSDSVPPSDAPTSLQPGTWLDRMPKSIQPYLYLTRIDKPIGTWLLLWPCSKDHFPRSERDQV